MKKKIINVIVILLISACMLMVGAKAATTIMASSVTYDGTTVEAALDELMSKIYHCPEGTNYLCNKDIKIGDYVTGTPGSSTFTIPASMTGYNTDQTIFTGSSNMWRIISINNDGTIDLVLEYVSSTPVYFKGEEGYRNFVGTLNWIASHYTSNMYGVVRTRHMGYDGQITYINSSASFFSKGNTRYRYATHYSGGDTFYKKDTDLVQSALGTLLAYPPNSSESVSYWLASRYYYNLGNADLWVGRAVSTDGSISYISNLYSTNGGAMNPNGVAAYIRPIITIMSDAPVDSGSGTKDNPWYID